LNQTHWNIDQRLNRLGL